MALFFNYRLPILRLTLNNNNNNFIKNFITHRFIRCQVVGVILMAGKYFPCVCVCMDSGENKKTFFIYRKWNIDPNVRIQDILERIKFSVPNMRYFIMSWPFSSKKTRTVTLCLLEHDHS